MHAGEGGVVLGAQPVRRLGPRRVATASAHGVDVVTGVHEHQQLVRGHLGCDDLHSAAVEQSELAGQARSQVQPDWCHRVGRPEVVRG